MAEAAPKEASRWLEAATLVTPAKHLKSESLGIRARSRVPEREAQAQITGRHNPLTDV